MTDEYLAAMQELWTSPAPAFAGKYTQFSAVRCDPKPVQRPHPPIWVGGHSAAALRRAVAFGAAWHPINRSAGEIRAGREAIAEICSTSGRATPPTVTMRIDTCVLESGRSAPAPLHGPSMLAGEPVALVDQVSELAAAGVEHLVLEFLAANGPEFESQMALFADVVRPKLG